jgi:hypothetical protein
LAAALQTTHTRFWGSISQLAHIGRKREAGVAVHYCAEQFKNGRISGILMTSNAPLAIRLFQQHASPLKLAYYSPMEVGGQDVNA